MARKQGFFAKLITSILKDAIAPTPEPRAERERRGPPSVPVRKVVAAELDPAWPAVPQRRRPVTLTATERSELPFDSALCPACGADAAPLPKYRKKCRSCGIEIHVFAETTLRRRMLVTEDQRGKLVAADEARVEREREQGERDWYMALQAMGIQLVSDPWEGDGETVSVVGESHYMTDLANLMAALRVDPDDRDAMAIALLQREPNNRYDRNAVRVLIHGRHVGYISREDAEDIQGWIRGLERAGIPAYVLARMGGGRVDEGRVGPIGVTLEDLPAVFG